MGWEFEDGSHSDLVRESSHCKHHSSTPIPSPFPQNVARYGDSAVTNSRRRGVVPVGLLCGYPSVGHSLSRAVGFVDRRQFEGACWGTSLFLESGLLTGRWRARRWRYRIFGRGLLLLRKGSGREEVRHSHGKRFTTSHVIVKCIAVARDRLVASSMHSSTTRSIMKAQGVQISSIHMTKASSFLFAIPIHYSNATVSAVFSRVILAHSIVFTHSFCESPRPYSPAH